MGSSVEGPSEFIVGRNYYKERQKKCLETLMHFAKQHSCALQFNDFKEKNPFTPANVIK